MKMPPAWFVLVSVLPHFPSITFLKLATFSGMKYQQPIMVSNDSWKTRNLCWAKFDSDNSILHTVGVLRRKRSLRQVSAPCVVSLRAVCTCLISNLLGVSHTSTLMSLINAWVLHVFQAILSLNGSSKVMGVRPLFTPFRIVPFSVVWSIPQLSDQVNQFVHSLGHVRNKESQLEY